MGAFEDEFKISASEHPSIRSTLDVMTMVHPNMAQLVTVMRRDLDQRHLDIDEKRGPMSGDGSFSILFGLLSTPSAVVRIGQIDNPPDSAIVLKHAARLIYKGSEEAEYQAHVLPFAPDVGKVTVQDMVNTIRVLRAEGYDDNFVDFGAQLEHLTGQFVFLKGTDGKILTYPTNAGDDNMAGKPIAFIRDLNCIQADKNDAKRMQVAGTSADFMDGLLEYLKKECTENEKLDSVKLKKKLTEAGIQLPDGPFDPGTLKLKIEDLAPAPAECVEACHQQDAIAEKTRNDLAAIGARLDGPSI
jgi:hypothetical protein